MLYTITREPLALTSVFGSKSVFDSNAAFLGPEETSSYARQSGRYSDNGTPVSGLALLSPRRPAFGQSPWTAGGPFARYTNVSSGESTTASASETTTRQW